MAESTASQIISAIGGAENVRSLTHCATRLRFELVDAGKVDQARLDGAKGVLGTVPQGDNRYQVVIGGGVANVYEDIMHLPEMANAGAAAGKGGKSGGQMTDAEVKAAERAKARGKFAWLDAFFEYLSDSFRPILGVLLGASIIIALVNLLISLNVIPNDEASAGWVFVKAIWKGVFYFLPIMIAYNASKKLKVDPWLGGAIMAMLMTPQFTSLIDTKTFTDTVCTTNEALGTTSCTAKIFGLPMLLSDYSGNVFVPSHRPAGCVGWQRDWCRPRLDERTCALHLRHRHPAAVPVPGAAGSALAAQRPYAHEHPDAGLRLHPGPDGYLELRLLRRHRWCAVPRRAR